MSVWNEKRVLTLENEQGSLNHSFKGCRACTAGTVKNVTDAGKYGIRPEEQTHFHRASQHSSSSLTVAGEGRSVMKETSHLVTRRRRESSTRDLKKGKLDL
ncbi:hypothetical protein Bca4012_020373 [Brassica carinata]